jgi:lipopolysaccharide export system permease protein
VTVYGRKVDHDGLIHDLFIHQQGGAGANATTYAALEGRVGRRGGQPVLVMRHGSYQSFSTSGVLNYLSFDEYIFDLSPFVKTEDTVRYKQSDRYLHELFYPDLSQQAERTNRLRLLAEGHSRLSSPLYNVAFMALALAAVLGGQFSRLGYGARIAAASAAAVAIRVLGFAIQAACDDSAALNVLQYAVPLITTVVGLSILFAGPRLKRARNRPDVASLAT